MTQPEYLQSLRITSLLHFNDGLPFIQLTSHQGKPLEDLPIAPPQQQHRAFILSTWMKSYEAMARKNGWGQFYKEHEPKIAESRWRDGWVVTDDDGYTVHGWVCGYDGKLWHVYVVPQLRRCRIGTRLIEFATGGLKEYAKPFPYAAHARVNPYLQCTKGQVVPGRYEANLAEETNSYARGTEETTAQETDRRGPGE